MAGDAVDANGKVHVLWLDHRELAEDASTAHHQHGASGGAKPDGVAMAQKSKLYIARSRAILGARDHRRRLLLLQNRDRDRVQTARSTRHGVTSIPAISATSRSRCHAIADKHSRPGRVSEDKWMLEGCPDDGPAMAVDARDRIHIVWPTLVTGRGADPTIALFQLRLPTARVYGAPADSHTGHFPASDPRGGRRRLKSSRRGMRERTALAGPRLDAGPWDSAGRATFTRSLVSGAEAAFYPVVAATTGAAIVAWTNGTGAGLRR